MKNAGRSLLDECGEQRAAWERCEEDRFRDLFDADAFRFREQWGWLAWDGILPILAVVGPILFSLIVPNRGFVFLLSVPFSGVLAMIRCGIGFQQLMDVCGRFPPLSRQLQMSLAIMMLMLFEFTANFVVQVVPTLQPRVAAERHCGMFLIVLSIYAVYLLFLAHALRPISAGPRAASPESDSTLMR